MLTANTISEFDAATGATINAAFVNGQGLNGPRGLLFVSAVPEPSSLLPVAAGAGVGVAPPPAETVGQA